MKTINSKRSTSKLIVTLNRTPHFGTVHTDTLLKLGESVRRDNWDFRSFLNSNTSTLTISALRTASRLSLIPSSIWHGWGFLVGKKKINLGTPEPAALKLISICRNSRRRGLTSAPPESPNEVPASGARPQGGHTEKNMPNGFSGAALFSREKPIKLSRTLGVPRVIRVEEIDLEQVEPRKRALARDAACWDRWCSNGHDHQ